jgi:hypothetical protein
VPACRMRCGSRIDARTWDLRNDCYVAMNSIEDVGRKSHSGWRYTFLDTAFLLSSVRRWRLGMTLSAAYTTVATRVFTACQVIDVVGQVANLP